MTVRVRSGPSFKGPLTIGSLRMLLFNYAFACKHGGVLVLRNEDTDRLRLVPSMFDDLYSALDWLEIYYQEGGRKGGSFGPYTQSERLPLYRTHAEQLVAKGQAYRCFCDEDRLTRERETKRSVGSHWKYDRRCLGLEPTEVARRASAEEPHVIRLKCPDKATPYTIDDMVYGKVTVDLSSLDDQVLLKSDGFPTYHLSSVIDDHYMNITHVIRSSVWLRNTAKHLFLYDCFDWTPPCFAHIPPILGSGVTNSVNEYRRLGFVPPALINQATMMGWRPKGQGELWDLNTLRKEFSLEGLKRKEATVDECRLHWLNHQHIKRSTAAELEKWVDSFIRVQDLGSQQFSCSLSGLRLLRPRLKTLRDLMVEYRYVFADPESYEFASSPGSFNSDLVRSAEMLTNKLHLIEPFDSTHIEDAIRDLAQATGAIPETLIRFLRLLITGSLSSPDLFDLMMSLGRDSCKRRMLKGIRSYRAITAELIADEFAV